jgi:hypothetical protein
MSDDQVPLYSLGDVQLRFLCPDDLDEVRSLCQDWFPIEYPFYWYEEITSSTRYLLTINHRSIVTVKLTKSFATQAGSILSLQCTTKP